MCLRKWITPFTKQCFVTLGVTLNTMSHGVVLGYTTNLLMQLKTNQAIPINEETASWIASIPEMALVFSTLIVPLVIRKCGRRVTNLISAIILTAAWFGFVICNNITTIIFLRILEGSALGFTGFLGAVMIGEYTTPRHRGAFLTTVSVSILFGVFLSQTLGTILSWKQAASVYGTIGLFDVVLIYLSPETPSFLAFHHKYDDCIKVFRWLRGFDDEEELEKMIKANKRNEEGKILEGRIIQFSLKRNLSLIINIVKKKEFYKPIMLMLNLYVWNMWTGAVAVCVYANEFFHGIIGPHTNFALMLISISLQNLISNLLSIIVFRHLKRRKIFLIGSLLMVFTLFAIGLYVCGKTYNLLPFDHPYIGAFLLHLQTFINSSVFGSLPNVMIGEITPLRYREVCGTISLLFGSANMALVLKTAPFLISTISLHGVYFLYGVVVCMAFIYPWYQLPETKDKTLLEIEEEFRGNPYSETEFTHPLSNDANVDAEDNTQDC